MINWIINKLNWQPVGDDLDFYYRTEYRNEYQEPRERRIHLERIF